jgi:metal-responsive CopG/Arc/MetJ family transcriptional regulator
MAGYKEEEAYMPVAMVKLAVENTVLEQIDSAAQKEQQTRTELILNAVKMYIQRQSVLTRLYSYGESVAAKAGFTEADVISEIKACRREST